MPLATPPEMLNAKCCQRQLRHAPQAHSRLTTIRITRSINLCQNHFHLSADRPSGGCAGGETKPGPHTSGMGSVWLKSNVVWTVLGLTGASIGTWWLVWFLMHRSDGASIANILALPLAAVSAATAVHGVRSRPRADNPEVLAAQARRLLMRVLAAEQDTLLRLLGDHGDPAPANLSFVRTASRVRADGGAASGTLDTASRYYGDLDRGRMIVVGGPGAGKTVLALRMLLDLASEEAATRDIARRIRVPVRLSLSTFALSPGPATPQSPTSARERLEDWIAVRISSTYHTKAEVIRALLTDGWILPVLDGLDEVDSDHDPADAQRAVLRALDQYAGSPRGRFLLTCREERYRELEDAAPQDTTVVAVRPLDEDQIARWLTHRFPDPSTLEGIDPRWQPVLTRIRRHPNGRLARCLSSPLKLYLAVSLYSGGAGSPAQMRSLDAEALDGHLLDGLTPALVREYPRPDGGHYDPGDVRRWMHTIARFLERRSRDGAPGPDFRLINLCDMVNTDPDRRMPLAGLLNAITVMLPLLFLGIYLIATQQKYLETADLAGMRKNRLASDPDMPTEVLNRVDNLAALYGWAMVMAAVVLAFLAWRSGRIPPGQLRTGYTLDIAMPVGIVATMLGALATMFALLALPAEWDALHAEASTVSRFSRPSRTVWTHRIPYLITVTLSAVAVTSTLVLDHFDMLHAFSPASWDAFAMSYVFGILVGFGLLRAVFGAPAIHFELARRSLAKSGLLPDHPGRLLDWAFHAGLMRFSGSAVQFRHHDIQTWLATAPTPHEAAWAARPEGGPSQARGGRG
jgi:hypothetical protein